MARKVFISVLGAGLYEKCKYVSGNFVSSETNFIQHATLQYLGAETWNPDSKVFILLTKKAETDNWIVPSGVRCDRVTNQEIPYQGLRDILSQMNLPFSVEPISIPDGKNEEEMWKIFESLLNMIDDEDELYFDQTHSFRYLPMLMLVFGNYVKFLKKASVCSITYGNYEARNKETNEAPIVNLLPISSLQDWTYATADFLKNGYADRLVELSQKGLSPLLRDEQTRFNENVQGLKKLVSHLETFTSEMLICRGMDTIASQTAESIKMDIDCLQNIIIPQLEPVLQKIYESLDVFSSSENVRNMFSAAKWCYNNHLYQQAITFLEEGAISVICQRHQIKLDDKEKRKLITSAFNILGEHKPEEEWRVNSDYVELLRKIVDDIQNNCENLVRPFNRIVNLRNDFNHCGMRENRSTATKIKNKIETLLNTIIPLLYPNNAEKEVRHEPLKRCFINLTNHPSEKWEKRQSEAAREYGEVVDMPFPKVSPESSYEEVSALAEEYVNLIREKCKDADVTVHVMGEMTFVYALVSRLKDIGIRCVASTTERKAVVNDDGTKTSEFSFVQFREY